MHHKRTASKPKIDSRPKTFSPTSTSITNTPSPTLLHPPISDAAAYTSAPPHSPKSSSAPSAAPAGSSTLAAAAAAPSAVAVVVVAGYVGYVAGGGGVDCVDRDGAAAGQKYPGILRPRIAAAGTAVAEGWNTAAGAVADSTAASRRTSVFEFVLIPVATTGPSHQMGRIPASRGCTGVVLGST